MLKQKNSLAFEQQFHCDICGEVVTTPLCPVCIAEEVEAWSTLYADVKKDLMPKLEAYLKKIREPLIEATQCLKCKKKRASICPFCFTDYILGQLKKLGTNYQIITEFLEFFDFEDIVPNPHAAKWRIYPDFS